MLRCFQIVDYQRVTSRDDGKRKKVVLTDYLIILF